MDNYTTTTLAGLVTTPASVTEYSLDAAAPFPTVFKIDATYDPTSKNAQSGVAVAEALKTVVIPVDQTYKPSSENPASGKAVKAAFDANGIYNTSTRIAMGYSVSVYTDTKGVGIGFNVQATKRGVSIGCDNKAGSSAVALGDSAQASAVNSAALGYKAKNADAGAVLIAANDGAGANSGWFTYLYLIGAGSPLAATYEGGAACLGYVVKDKNGNIAERGTRKLSELLTNNTDFTPASLDPDAPEPTPFTPTGITDPIEFPEEPEGFSEPEQVTE